MPRRGKAIKRPIAPDAVYHSTDVTRFIRKIMACGKKTVAERILYEAFDIVAKETKRNPLDVFEQALRNVTPAIEVKPRRVGGATYQVPVDIREGRRLALAIRWLLAATKARKGRPMAERLATELMDASRGQGATIKKRDETHRMAEANKAFAHYRW